MIIICDKCSKKYTVDSNLIPENGRLLQCSDCDHKWFFKKEIINEPDISTNIDEIKSNDEELENLNVKSSNSVELFDNVVKEDLKLKKNFDEKYDDYDKNLNLVVDLHQNKKKFNLLGLIIIFLTSFIALIIILDTFQEPLKKIIPNIEFLLYSLYETINDISLFLKDLF
tara:strand:- start:242 stop:751 length:510 start_codon:yes stop_codon:yes gene_type:complete